MTEQQTQGLGGIVVNVPGDLVGRPDAGMIRITLPEDTPPAAMRDAALAAAKAQADKAGLGFQAPGSGGQVRAEAQLPVDMPEGFSDQMTEVAAMFPQLAGFAAQFLPGVRALSAAGSAAIPAMARAGTNVIEGKPVGEGVIGEAALGGALHMPTTLGNASANWAESIMRQNLFRETPIDEITDRMRDVLPEKALRARAAPTREGVENIQRNHLVPAYDKATDLQGQVASYTGAKYQPPPELTKALQDAELDFDDLREITNMLKAVEKQSQVRGNAGGASAVLSGSGPVTAAGRAAGIMPAIGQIASPAVAAMKGSPARRMAWARNLHRPGNVVDADALGLGVSQLLRLLAASQMKPVASHETASVGTGGLPPAAPRRRQ